MNLQEQFLQTRKDDTRVVLEGFHAIKHALRFKAEIEMIVASKLSDFKNLCKSHALDLQNKFESRVQIVSEQEYKTLSPHPHRTGIIGIAKRRDYSFDETQTHIDRPIVLLDHPSHPDNVGASIRVAAAANAAGVILLGSSIDLWGPQVVRGAAGLHFALPVLKLEKLPDTSRTLIALDERGEELDKNVNTTNSILIFGSERQGISDELKQRVNKIIRIPMHEGVSSLNLATSVAVVLYSNS